MKKKINFIIIFSLIIFIFFTLIISLNKNSTYTTTNIKNVNIENFKSKELFSDEIINFINPNFKKKITILNIWASWCLPCRTEHEFLMNLSENKEVMLVGLNYKDKTENAKSFLNELGNPYEKVLIDDKGLISIELGAFGVPETYIINNQEKKIIKKYVGPIDEIKSKEIESLVKS